MSRLSDLRKEFSFAFKNADEVILCPIYAAGEKIKLSFNYQNFAKEIIKNSNVQVFMVENQFQIAKFIKQTFYSKKIVIGMGFYFIDERITKTDLMDLENYKIN